MADTPREQRQDSILQQVVSALRKPWVEGQSLQIIDGKPTWGDPPSGGGGGAFAGGEYQMTTDQAVNTNAPLPFGLEIFSIDTMNSAGRMYPLTEGWWTAWAYLVFFGVGSVSDGTLEGVLNFSDTNDLYKHREESWPMRPSSGVAYTAGRVEMEPVLIDSSYVNPLFYVMGNTHQMGSSGSPSGSLKGFSTAAANICRAGIYRVG